MAHTDYTTVLAKAIYDKLNLNKGALGLVDVLFGNQNMIPDSPTVVVNPGAKRKNLMGVSSPGGRTQNLMTVYIWIHSAKVGDEFTERLKLDQIAEAVEDFIDQDTTVGGLIIHGFINDWDPGETPFGSSMFRSVRMTFIGESRTYLSS